MNETNTEYIGEPVYQLQLSSGRWIDQSESQYNYNKAHESNTVRILYTTPQPHPAPQAGEVTDEQLESCALAAGFSYEPATGAIWAVDGYGGTRVDPGLRKYTRIILALRTPLCPERMSVTEWQPIETAPKDGPFLAVIDCGGDQSICTMRYAVAEAKNSRPEGEFIRERVTHWMPLPALPESLYNAITAKAKKEDA